MSEFDGNRLLRNTIKKFEVISTHGNTAIVSNTTCRFCAVKLSNALTVCGSTVCQAKIISEIEERYRIAGGWHKVFAFKGYKYKPYSMEQKVERRAKELKAEVAERNKKL